MVLPFMPASMHAFSLARTYTALAGSSPTSTTVRPGVTPRAISAAASRATSARTCLAMATPSMSLAASTPSSTLAGNVYGPLFTDGDNLDLPRILQLGFPPTRDLVGERLHPQVIHVVRVHDHADLAPRLDGEHAVHATVTRGDLLQPLEPLHVRLKCLAARAGARPADGVGRLHQHRLLALVRHVVVVRGDAVHDERVLAVLGRLLHAQLHVRPFVLVRHHLADVVQQRAALAERHVKSEFGGHDA